MKRRRQITQIVISIMLLTGGLLASPVVMDLAFDKCGITRQHADQKVQDFIKRKNLKTDLAEFESQRGTCRYSYKYKDGNHEVSMVLISSYLHGPKLTSWDSQENQ